VSAAPEAAGNAAAIGTHAHVYVRNPERSCSRSAPFGVAERRKSCADALFPRKPLVL
jgi:hypothetical protein